MSPEAGYETLMTSLGDIECACAKGEPGRAGALFEMFDLALRRAMGAGRLDATQMGRLQEKALGLVQVLSVQREGLAGEMARAQHAGRATRAYLGDS